MRSRRGLPRDETVASRRSIRSSIALGGIGIDQGCGSSPDLTGHA